MNDAFITVSVNSVSGFHWFPLTFLHTMEVNGYQQFSKYLLYKSKQMEPYYKVLTIIFNNCY